MRKFFLFFVAALILSSCDNLKTKDKSDSDKEDVTPKKKKKALAEDEPTDEEETPKKKKPAIEESEDDKPIVVTVTEDGAELRWTTSDRKKFMNECVETAAKNVGEEVANTYCSCFLGKLEKKYISYNETKMTDAEKNKWAAECNQ